MLREKIYDFLPRVRRQYVDKQIFNLLLAAVIGVLSGYGDLFFHYAMKGAQYVFYQSTDDILTFAHTLPWYFFICMPALGGLVVGLIVHFGAREAKGHGVTEVMQALALEGGIIRKRVAFVKILASAICLGSGGSAGPEGPMVQIGAGIGSTVGQVFKVPTMTQRTMVGCGAAAGIAATFNAPIAGTLFALEIILNDFGLASFSPVVLASVTATAVSRHYFGDFPAFSVPVYELSSLWEFCIYPFLGLFAGLVAVLFIVVLYKCEDFFNALKLPEWFKPVIGGLLLGLILLKFPQVFGAGYEGMNLALRNQMPGLLLLALIFLKIISTSFTLGSGGSGGIFAPSLFVGAMTGGFFGWVVNILFPGVTASAGAYALVGMGAVMAAGLGAPITSILLVFEMTGDYKIILPMMIACILSTIMASSIKEGSMYTLKLMKRGVDIAGGLEQNILRALKVRQFMNTDVITVPERMPLVDIINTFKTMDVSYLHVINTQGDLTGIISFRDIRGLLEEEGLRRLIIAKDVATTKLVTVGPEDNIQVALRLMSEWGISQVPVVGGENGRKVLGALREKDVIAAYDKAVIRREIEAA